RNTSKTKTGTQLYKIVTSYQAGPYDIYLSMAGAGRVSISTIWQANCHRPLPFERVGREIPRQSLSASAHDTTAGPARRTARHRLGIMYTPAHGSYGCANAGPYSQPECRLPFFGTKSLERQSRSDGDCPRPRLHYRSR